MSSSAWLRPPPTFGIAEPKHIPLPVSLFTTLTSAAYPIAAVVRLSPSAGRTPLWHAVSAQPCATQIGRTSFAYERKVTVQLFVTLQVAPPLQPH